MAPIWKKTRAQDKQGDTNDPRSRSRSASPPAAAPSAPCRPTFHDAIQQFINTPTTKTKPPPLFRKKKGKKRDARLEKPQFVLSKESALPPEDENASPRRFDGSSTELQFKSQAVYCEVKLTELLSKTKEEREKPATPGKYNEAPDAYRTSVCCQLLAEVSTLAQPFTTVLVILHHELEQAIYSNYVTPSPVSIFEQVPYFELVGSLEKKNKDLVQERETLKIVVSEKDSCIEEINKVIEDLNKQILEKHGIIADLQHNLTATIRTLEKSSKEVERLSDQVAKSRLEVFHARETEKALEEAEYKYENLMAKHVNIVHELQHYQSNLEVARKEAAEGVPKKEMALLKAQNKDLQQRLLKAELLTEQMETMTPRPQWALLRGGAYYTMSTAAQAAEICKLNDMLLENVTTLRVECATAQVALAEVKQKKKPGVAGGVVKGKPTPSPKSGPPEQVRPNST